MKIVYESKKLNEALANEIASLDPTGEYSDWLIDQYEEGHLGKDSNGRWVYSGKPVKNVLKFFKMIGV